MRQHSLRAKPAVPPRFSFSPQARRDSVGFLLLGLCLTASLLWLDSFDWFVGFAMTHEHWELDELATALCVMGGLGYVFAWRRIAELRGEILRREQAEGEARHLASHDALTGLPNRRSLSAHFDALSASRRQSDFYLTILDLDGFKAINDLHGHATGDALLLEVSRRLELCFGADFVCRLAGDEFAVIVSSAESEAAARSLIERAAAALQQPMQVEGRALQVSATFGVAVWPADGQQLSLLLRRADQALYQGKNLNRSSVRFFSAELDQQIEARSRVEAAVREGLSHGRLSVHFQPIVELASGRIAGFEAMARLHDPELGSVAPESLIAAAERAGLIVQVAEQLLERACHAAAAWPDELFLSFNLSPMQLRDRLLVERLLRVLERSGLAPTRLELEVTEMAILLDADEAEQTFTRLRALGMRVSVDDFGAGYSSLGRLQGFRFDKLKIDPAFTQAIGQPGRGEDILEGLLGLARGLNSDALAEGVETSAQAHWLMQRGCRYGQGYFFGEVLPEEAVLPMLREQTQAADGAWQREAS
jgi:diguanylate cyclase (GGDEF)-like protein